MTTAVVVLVIGLPLAGFALWPLLRRGGGGTVLPVPPDAREQLAEQKRRVLRALRELEFEHEAGHVSDDDYRELRARYEAEAAEVIAELDRLGEPPRRGRAEEPAPPVAAARGWRHPIAVAAAAAALVVFGVALGVGIVRYTEPDATAGMPAPGSRALAPALEPGAPPQAGGSGRPLSPEMLGGMLQAARASLQAGRVGEAFTAYRAVLARDPDNVDALTHMALIAARVEGHTDDALKLLDRALGLDPRYPPALLYRGHILYEVKGDAEGAIRSWERFLEVVPDGEDHREVKRMIAEARKGKPGR